jgi:N-acetyltransferase
VFRAFFGEALASGGALVAIDRSDGRVIGTSRFHGHDPAASEVEIGWTFLARFYWGGAWNGEMKRLMLAHAFRFVEKVLFRVGPENGRSRRAVEKIGGVLAGSCVRDGRESVVYRVRAADFATGPLGA